MLIPIKINEIIIKLIKTKIKSVQPINKYKSSLLINYDNIIYFENLSKKIVKPTNYLFIPRNKFLRNFINFYSMFLISLPFSTYCYKKSPQSNLKLKLSALILLSIDYNELLT